MTPPTIDAGDDGAIIALLNRYAVAVDMRCWEMLGEIFTADAKLDYFGSRWDDLPSFQADFGAAHEVFTATQHGIGNHLVTVGANRARALSQCQWRLIRAGTEGGDVYAGAAWYDDQLVRTDRGWRIADRICGIIWTEGNPAVAGAVSAPPCEPLHEAHRAGRLRMFPQGEGVQSSECAHG